MYDGDTLTFLPDSRKQEEEEWTIRLAEIDAPESEQPYGKESGEYLRVIQIFFQVPQNRRNDSFNISYIYI